MARSSALMTRTLMIPLAGALALSAAPALAAFEFVPPVAVPAAQAPAPAPARAYAAPAMPAVPAYAVIPELPSAMTPSPSYGYAQGQMQAAMPAPAPAYQMPAPRAPMPIAGLTTGFAQGEMPVHVAPRVSADVSLAPSHAPVYAPSGAPIAPAAIYQQPAMAPAYAPVYQAPVPSAPAVLAAPSNLSAGGMVDQALNVSSAQMVPQSILPPAQAAYQYDPAPQVQPDTYGVATRTIRRDRAAAQHGAPALNMNPLGLAAPAPAPTPAPQASQSQNLEQAMVQGASSAYGAMGRSGMGGMPLPAASGASYVEAVGFGRDLPLALAVSQIVPPDYAFTFDNSVNPGTAVSWEGGKPWNIVLQETLAASGSSARIDDVKKEITIAAGGAFAPAPAPAPVYAAAPAPVAPAPRAPMPVAYQMTQAPAQPVAAPAAAAPSAPHIQLSGLSRPSVLDAKNVRVWEASRGSSLRSILRDWSLQAGVELFWSSDFDFPVESAVRLETTFEEAVQTLLNGLRDAQPRPIGRLHPNLPDGPSVLVIETRHVLE